MTTISEHYDLLIENGNDPVSDTPELKKYMDRWDGGAFTRCLAPSKRKVLLEIGCGTGRIFSKLCDRYRSYTGIDLSPKTIARARERFAQYGRAQFVCDDFLHHAFSEKFDLVFSTLTFMHIQDKEKAVGKVFALLRKNGRFVLSTDKDQRTEIDTGYSRIGLFPDDPKVIKDILIRCGFTLSRTLETQAAHLFVADKISSDE